MSPSGPRSDSALHENKVTNRIRAAQDPLPHPIEHRACELQVALRLIRLAHDG